MNPEAQRVRDLFVKAVQLPPDRREAFLKGACVGDEVVRGRINDLLWEHQQAGSFLDRPAIALRATDSFDPTTSGAAAAAAPDGPGTTIGPYKLLELIGEGGMGAVWMAEQREPVQRQVALKIIKAGMDTCQAVARFEAERQALALMDHPNIAKVFDGGTAAGGRPYFVMELVKGVPITRYCDEQRLTPRQRLELFVSVCQAIQHAHQKGIIHRDIKPANVLVAPCDGRPVVKVIDFGVAKGIGQRLTARSLFTSCGVVVGTLEYMSPEQAELNNHDIDTRSDIYSLGVLLYELLTGTTPLRHERLKEEAFTEILRVIREEEPPRPSTRLSESKDSLPSISAQRHMEPVQLTKLVRGELDWIVMRCLEKDRNCRYQTANGLARDVEHYLADEPVRACPPSVAYRCRKFARRNKVGLAVAGLVLFFLILLGGGSGWVLRDREARRAETAQQARDSLTRARQWAGENKLALARQELAAARERLGSDRAALAGLAEEIEALGAELGRYESFLDLVDQAHEAEFPQAVAFPEASDPERERARAVPLFLGALSCYCVLDHEDWSTRLEAGLLEPGQVARVRRMAYEALLWLADDLVRRGRDHRSGRKLSPQEAAQEGLAYLRQGEAAAPPTLAFYQVRARLLNALGRKEEARKDEERVRQTPGTIALDHYLQAVAAFYARDKAPAVKHCEAALRIEPTHYWSLLGLGSCLATLGREEQDFALAASAYTGCILRRPNHALPFLGRGFAYQKLNRHQEAEADFRQALRLRPDYLEARINLAWALSDQRKYAEAEAEGREALRRRPDLPEAHVAHDNLGVALLEQAKYREAEVEFREALRLRPDFPLARCNLSNALHDQGRYAEAEAEGREALRVRPDFPEAHIAHNNLGRALDAQGKHAEAEAEYREALRLRPDYALAHNNLGANLEDHQGKHAEAEAEFRQALRLRPDYPWAHCNLGIALCRQGKPAAAARSYAEAFAAYPELADDLRVPNRYNAACCAALAGCGQPKDAANLDDAERARLRRQALGWLRADLAAWGELLEKQPEQARGRVRQTLRQWQQDADFAGVRGDALAQLPEPERQTWQQLWADVERTLRRVDDKGTKDTQRQPPK
jgi:serine/threonine protein kinase/tetratricopeptide (TPR) repeat protein